MNCDMCHRFIASTVNVNQIRMRGKKELKIYHRALVNNKTTLAKQTNIEYYMSKGRSTYFQSAALAYVEEIDSSAKLI
jgi:hypothetical protein